MRQYNQQYSSATEPRVDPLQAAQTPVDEMMRSAYVKCSLLYFLCSRGIHEGITD